MEFNKRSFAIAGAILVVFIWSGWITISRLGVQTKLSPLDISMLRFATAMIFTIPLWFSYPWRTVSIPKSIFIALGTGCVYTMFSFYGLQSAKAAKAGVVVNGLLPVFGALLAMLWLKAPMKPKHFIGIGIILIANALMFFSEGLNLNATQIKGLAFLILASLVYSSYAIGVKAWGFRFKDVIVLVPLINTLVLLPFWLSFPSHIQEASIKEILLQSSYQGILVTIGAGILITNAIEHIGPVMVSLFMAFVPTTTAILAFFLLGEDLGYIEMISIVLCTLGIFIYTKNK